MKLHVQVITPEKTIIDTQADSITVPTTSGEITILSEHIPLISEVKHGVIIIRSDGKEEHIVIDGGFVDIQHNNISILADYAIHGKDIQIAKAQEAKDRAEKLLKEKHSDQDLLVAEAELRKAILELKVGKQLKGTA